jgi:hypothetical protein
MPRGGGKVPNAEYLVPSTQYRVLNPGASVLYFFPAILCARKRLPIFCGDSSFK